VAGLVGRPVLNPGGTDVGRVADLVVRGEADNYPRVAGVIVRVGRRRVWVPVTQVAAIARDRVTLASARLDLIEFTRRPGEVALGADVLDRQVVDTDGVRVVRASDLYVADVAGCWRLVGVDVGVRTLVRRLGPARWRDRPTPDRVIDWAAVEPFGDPPRTLRLAESRRELHRLRPGELADLLEQLGRAERQALLAAVGTDAAADALEEMNPTELGDLLRASPPDQVTALVASMEPDEAADALRGLGADERQDVLDALPADLAETLGSLSSFQPRTAGGCMTSRLVLCRPDDTVNEVRRRLRTEAEHRADIDGVLVVDDDGRLLDDVSLFELVVSPDGATLADLVGEPWPVTVTPDQPLDDVVEALAANRGSSLVVVDPDGRPVGRILADDVVDALVPAEGRFRFRGILR
jgi:CBS domain-containing protein